MAEYIDVNAAWDESTLTDWYITSVSQDDPPVWTPEHISELCEDFYVIPKETPKADVMHEVEPDGIGQLFNELTAYRNTGLTPEEIVVMKNKMNN